MSEHFFITLSSDSQCEYRHQNNTGDFKVHLGRTLELEGNWEVALFELFYPCTLPNVRANACKIIRERTSVDRETGMVGFTGDGGFEITLLDSNNYNNEKELIEHINKKMHPALTCEIDKHKKVSIYMNEMNDQTEYSTYFLADKLKDILGFPRTLTLDAPSVLKTAYAPQVLSNLTVFNSDTPADLRRGLTSTLYVCTDLIAEQWFNNTHARVLRTVTTNASKYNAGFTNKVEFAKLVFLPVAKRKTEAISLYIKDDAGDIISFAHGVLTVVLLFRKVGHE